MTKPYLLLLLVGLSFSASGEEGSAVDPLAGHSYHGDVFNEGPRQAAVLLEGMGEIDFPVTTNSPEAQAFIDQGIGQLHGFWDFEAERSFRQAAMLDPDCAMAYWGMAQANLDNEERLGGFVEQAMERKAEASARERIYIEGLAKYFDDSKAEKKKRLRALVRVYEEIIREFPNDLEAKAFLAKQLYFNNRKGIEYSSHYIHDKLIEEILVRSPMHPVHHYRIHLWDKEKAEMALEAAAKCGPAAPGIAHMWHMPGHIYAKEKRYRDVAWQQEASARIDHAHMMRYQIVPDQISNFAHNNEWLIRNLNQLGRVEESLDLARNMIELPRLAKFEGEGAERKYQPNGSWQYGKQRLRDTMFQFELWEALIATAENSAYLSADGEVISDLEWNRILAIAKYETGDRVAAAEHLAAVERSLAEQTAKQVEAVEAAGKSAEAAKKDNKGIEAAKAAAKKKSEKERKKREDAVNEIRVYAALTAERVEAETAVKLLPDLEDIPKARRADLWMRAGDAEKAITLAKEAVRSGEGEVYPLAIRVAIMHAVGMEVEARAAFSELRVVAGKANLDLPVLQYLAPIAQEFGYPEDWRTPAAAAKDLGARPELAALGPFRWSPPAAADWTLAGIRGKEVSLADYRGRPVLVIFYLGKGCAHCMEQLNLFSPLTERYRKAGIPIVAIGTDTVAGLAETFAGEGGNAFPFPLLSNAGMDIFKAYRAFDDFEKQPLHGTYLLDGVGKIRWQDISYEPFMEAEWLLEESQRLLSFDES